jgi:gamma-glutamyltranspeptidase/glutathione hydrolase
MKHATLAVLLLAAACSATGSGAPVLYAGVVVSPEPNASKVGAEILRRNGNAVDAAVAVHFALAVTFPNAGNLGGGGFMMVHGPDGGVHALDYREMAPGAAHRDMYLDPKGNVVEGLSLHSRLAGGVPGSVMGMWEAHRKFGALPWKDVLAPAIRLAAEGWKLDEWSARSFAAAAREAEGLPEVYRRVNNFARYYRGKAGDRFVQPELASTLRRISDQGPDGFYKGETADMILRASVITMDDLSNYRAHWRTPVEGSYRGHRVVSMPPPSSGGIALLQLLNMLERFEAPPFHSPEHVHLVAEIEKRVFADRSVHLGDPDFYKVPVRKLTDKEYCRGRASTIRRDARTQPGDVREGTIEKESTTHFSVVDRRGMAVSNTTTLNDGYGCGIVVEGAGFLLNNEMDDFTSKPGVPNMYGMIGAEANKVEPRKRPLSSMTPTFVFDRDGRLWLVLGTPGGPTIFTTVFQVIVNKVDYRMAIAEAVNSPRFHHQWPPRSKDADPIFVEDGRGFPPATIEALRKLGYAIQPRGRLGDVHAIEIQGGRATGAPDARGIGKSEYVVRNNPSEALPADPY